MTDSDRKYQTLVDAGYQVERIPAVGRAKNTQAAIEMAEKVIYGGYDEAVIEQSRALDWLEWEVQKQLQGQPTHPIFAQWLPKIKNDWGRVRHVGLKRSLQPLLSI